MDKTNTTNTKYDKKKRIRLNKKSANKAFRSYVNLDEMHALKAKRERGNSSDYNYSDTSSIKKCKTQFRYLRKQVDENYRNKFMRQNYHAGYSDSIAGNMIQSNLGDYSCSYSPSCSSDDTLNWVEDNITSVRNKFFKNYDDFKNRGLEYLDDPDKYSNIKICDEISPDAAGEIYSYCENPGENEMLFSVMKAYFNFWMCEGKIFEEGLGRSRYSFFREELKRIDNFYGGYENQPEEENVYMTAPMRCMTYYIHNPSKLHERYKKVEIMRSKDKLFY